MKSFIVLAVLVAAALAGPVNPDANAEVLRSDLDNIGVNGYAYNYETSNGIRAEATGELKNPGSENEFVAVRGSFSYPGPDGKVYSVSYVADENGYQAQGDHLN